MALRDRVVVFIDEGNSHREAARHVRVSPRFVNDMTKLRRDTGQLAAKRQGDLTLDALVCEISATHGIEVHCSAVGRLLHRLGLTHKKDLQAPEQARPDVAARRRFWQRQRQPAMAGHLERLVFLNETWLKTNMIKTTGLAPKGERLVDHAPFGHWNTQTFIAALRHDRLDTPWVIPGAINAELFAIHVETQLAPTLSPRNVVILDNHSSHKTPRAAEALRKVGASFLFLPPYSPDLNPIEMAFSKFTTLIRKAAARN